MKYIGLTLMLSYCVNSASIPSYVNLCKRNDPDLSSCFIKTFNEIRDNLRKGIPEMEIPPGDPIAFHNVSASSGETKSLHFRAKSWDQIADGLMDVEIQKFTFDFEKATCFMKLRFPFARLRGNYHIDGKVMLFEIDAVGKYDLNTTNMISNAELYGRYLDKNGKQYLEITSVKPGLTPDGISIYFENLIPGNPVLTTTLNRAINENIKILYEDLAPVIDEVFGALAKQYFNIVFHLFSMDELFPQD